MWIKTQEDELVNTDLCKKISLVYTDNYVIEEMKKSFDEFSKNHYGWNYTKFMSSYVSNEFRCHKIMADDTFLGLYINKEKANKVLDMILKSIIDGNQVFVMPEKGVK